MCAIRHKSCCAPIATPNAKLDTFVSSSNRSILINAYACRTVKFRYLPRAVLTSFPPFDSWDMPQVQHFSWLTHSSWIRQQKSRLSRTISYALQCHTLACIEGHDSWAVREDAPDAVVVSVWNENSSIGCNRDTDLLALRCQHRNKT